MAAESARISSTAGLLESQDRNISEAGYEEVVVQVAGGVPEADADVVSHSLLPCDVSFRDSARRQADVDAVFKEELGLERTNNRHSMKRFFDGLCQLLVASFSVADDDYELEGFLVPDTKTVIADMWIMTHKPE